MADLNETPRNVNTYKSVRPYLRQKIDETREKHLNKPSQPETVEPPSDDVSQFDQPEAEEVQLGQNELVQIEPVGKQPVELKSPITQDQPMTETGEESSSSTPEEEIADPKKESKLKRRRYNFMALDTVELLRLCQELDPCMFVIFQWFTIKGYGWDKDTKKVGDGTVKIGTPKLAKQFNISESTIKRHLKVLIEKKMITAIERKSQGGWTNGNVYQIQPILLAKEKEFELGQNELVENEPVQNELVNQVKLNQLTRSNWTSCIKVLDPRFLDTLSLNSERAALEKIQAYFETIKSAPEGYKTEVKAFEQIRLANPDLNFEILYGCFKETKGKDLDGKGQKVNKPFVWLSRGDLNKELLDRVKTRIERNKQQQSPQAPKEETKPHQGHSETSGDVSEVSDEEKIELFRKRFPSEKEQQDELKARIASPAMTQKMRLRQVANHWYAEFMGLGMPDDFPAT